MSCCTLPSRQPGPGGGRASMHTLSMLCASSKTTMHSFSSSRLTMLLTCAAGAHTWHPQCVSGTCSGSGSRSRPVTSAVELAQPYWVASHAALTRYPAVRYTKRCKPCCMTPAQPAMGTRPLKASQASRHGTRPPARLGVQHVLVVVDHHVGEREHVPREEVGAPALLAPVLPQVVQRVHARVQHLPHETGVGQAARDL